MESQFNNPKFSDVILELVNPEGQRTAVYARKDVLSESSDYFRTLFTSQFRETRQNKITLEVPDIQMAIDLIHWMYTEDPVPPEHTIPLSIMWLVVEEVPYPGPPGKFVQDPKYGDWTIKSEPTIQQIRHRQPGRETGGRREPKSSRQIGYESITPTSSIKRVEFYENTNRELLQVTIYIRSEYLDKFQEYLDLFPGLFNAFHFRESQGTYYVIDKIRNMTDGKILTEIVLTNNEFSPEDQQFINNQIFGGTLQLETAVVAIRTYHKGEIPYPWPPETFSYDEKYGDWTPENVPKGALQSIDLLGKKIVRTITFNTPIGVSISINEMHFYETEDGSIIVGISFGIKTKIYMFKRYLDQFPGLINAIKWEYRITMYVDDPKYAKIITEIILNNNNFSPEDKEFINKEIFKGTLHLK